jgi:CMP-N-acetylneuraminic acid synthetase
MNPYVVGFIFARGGSKGVPRKNIRPLLGKPLIAYAIQTAHASRWINRVIVSTDDKEIADVAREFGAEVPFLRPPELARDDSPEWLAWQNALRTLQDMPGERKIDIFINIPTTSPLRSAEDVDRCVELLLEGNVDIVVSARLAQRNPYYNMITIDENEMAHLVIQPEKRIDWRQYAPVVYDITTVAYAARPSFILKASGIFDGKVKAIIVPPERALYIDSEMDFQIAEFLMRCKEE